MDSSTKRSLVTYGYIKKYIMPLWNTNASVNVESIPQTVMDLCAQYFDSRYAVLVHANVCIEQALPLFAMFTNSRTHRCTVFVETDDTIASIKRHLHYKLNPALESNVNMEFNGITLLDRRTVHDYNITAGSVLKAWLIPKTLEQTKPSSSLLAAQDEPAQSTTPAMDEPCQVRIKSLAPWQITLDVHPKDTVLELKRQIFTQKQIAPKTQNLICNGVQLDDDNRTLHDYGVPKQATIYLSLHLL